MLWNYVEVSRGVSFGQKECYAAILWHIGVKKLEGSGGALFRQKESFSATWWHQWAILGGRQFLREFRGGARSGVSSFEWFEYGLSRNKIVETVSSFQFKM